MNLISMLSWSFEFEDKEYFEGFRSLATNGVDKPVLNVFRMSGMMAGDRVSTTSSGQVPLDTLVKTGVHETPDVDAFATKAEHEAAVLLWNYHDVDVPAGARRCTVTIAAFRPGCNACCWSTIGSTRRTATPIPCGRRWARRSIRRRSSMRSSRPRGSLQMLTSPVWLDVATAR